MSNKCINAYCAICGEKIPYDNESLIKSKPRKGSPIYIHADCYNKEQKEVKKS